MLKDAARLIGGHEIIFRQEVFYINRQLLEKTQNTIVNFFQSKDQLAAIDQLRSLIKPKIDLKLFKVLLAELVAIKKLFFIGSKYAISNQGLVFTDQEQIIWDKVVLILNREQFNPSPIRNIALETGIAEALLQSVFFKAIAQELLVYVGNHVYYPFHTIKKIAEITQNIFEETQQITVIELKNRLQIGRNRVVLVIETFDKMGFTYRIIRKDSNNTQVNDYRIIKNKKIFFEK
jgi:selenocysteine-specific elongation factor